MKSISQEDVKIAARNVRNRIYDGEGQKWAFTLRRKIYNSQAIGQMRKLLRRNSQRVGKALNCSFDIESDSENDDEVDS